MPSCRANLQIGRLLSLHVFALLTEVNVVVLASNGHRHTKLHSLELELSKKESDLLLLQESCDKHNKEVCVLQEALSVANRRSITLVPKDEQRRGESRQNRE